MVNVAVNMLRQVPAVLFLTAGGALHSVHRQRGGFPRCEQRQVPRVVEQTVETPQLQFLGVALLRRAWFDSGYMLFVSLRRFGSFLHMFYVIVNWVPEVTSCPSPGANGQVCTDEASVARGVHVDIWTLLPQARRIWQSLGSLSALG